MIRIGVVIASQDARKTVHRCLAAIGLQRTPQVGLVVLVDNSDDGTAAYVKGQFPWVRVIERTGRMLVPQLWAEGILAGDEEVIALTTAEMEPEPGWLDTMLRGHSSGTWAAVGGPILAGHGLDASDSAIYWLRYHRFATLPAAGNVMDVAGDNASYRRAAVMPFSGVLQRHGFWENEINSALVEGGARLYHEPGARMHYRGGTSYARFARQRILHGRRFGTYRTRSMSLPRRGLQVAAWPLGLLVFAGRIVRSAMTAGGGSELARAAPRLLGLIACWSVGELAGYLVAREQGAGQRRTRQFAPSDSWE